MIDPKHAIDAWRRYKEHGPFEPGPHRLYAAEGFFYGWWWSHMNEPDISSIVDYCMTEIMDE